MKHTLGPWIVNKTKKCLIDAPNENRIIAEARGGDLEERRANACLIAAAPELLAAAEWFLIVTRKDEVYSARIKLVNAINKARGF